ncbi:hypothetical protein AU210_016269 [Fusarium oxysporum f. sp. radicis-cucumerinum]|uniref:Uncharacterized protein n=1 Tax=Fusarium oxysporum f. sp. radicis-cucumerinum TaxID=327505 RepID=A0A2H3G6H5_FUSOX|nr:hypothetical protein AU210_016269 [Fusarium oxysporum f. sp. radicis-cucumerinum]
MSEDDWIEDKFAYFQAWVEKFNADERGPDSLDSRLRLRPDIREVFVDVLDVLIMSLKRCTEISRDRSTRDSEPTHAGDEHPSADGEGRSASPWSDMGDNTGSQPDSPAKGNNDEEHLDLYKEQKFYIDMSIDLFLSLFQSVHEIPTKEAKNQHEPLVHRPRAKRKASQEPCAQDYKPIPPAALSSFESKESVATDISATPASKPASLRKREYMHWDITGIDLMVIDYMLEIQVQGIASIQGLFETIKGVGQSKGTADMTYEMKGDGEETLRQIDGANTISRPIQSTPLSSQDRACTRSPSEKDEEILEIVQTLRQKPNSSSLSGLLDWIVGKPESIIQRPDYETLAAALNECRMITSQLRLWAYNLSRDETQREQLVCELEEKNKKLLSLFNTG